jgi:hypothetical protein
MTLVAVHLGHGIGRDRSVTVEVFGREVPRVLT